MSNTNPLPPTPLATLESMHALCMQLESYCDDIKLMGIDVEFDDIESDVHDLTFNIQSLIEDIE